jgi:hypothetical protein
MDLKICTKCKIGKSLDNFNLEKRRGSYRPRCKQCQNEDSKKYHQKIQKEGYIECETSFCIKCKQTLPFKEFIKDKRKPKGIDSNCKTCNRERLKKYDKPKTTHIQVEEKVCTSCGILKPKSEYYKNSYKIDGLTSSCKFCKYLEKKKKDKKYIEREFVSTPEIKSCSKCKMEKGITSFGVVRVNADGRDYNCKSCNSEEKKAYREKYKDILRERTKTPKILSRKKEYNREYIKINRGTILKKQVERYKTDIQYRLSLRLRGRVIDALRGKAKKSAKTMELIGCTIGYLKEYLEARFLPTMTWDNYGPEWHIDHIIPVSSFDLSNPNQQKECFHHTNLQPLFATTRVIDGVEYLGNLNKGDKHIKEISSPIITN